MKFYSLSRVVVYSALCVIIACSFYVFGCAGSDPQEAVPRRNQPVDSLMSIDSVRVFETDSSRQSPDSFDTRTAGIIIDDTDLSDIGRMVFDAWINLMPGGEPKFFIAGEVNIINTSNGELRKISCGPVRIFDRYKTLSEVFLEMVPIEGVSPSIKTGKEKTFKLFMQDGIDPSFLDDRTVVSIECELFVDDFPVQIRIDSLTVQKVY